MMRAAARRLGAATVLTFDRKAAALEGNVIVVAQCDVAGGLAASPET
jgi:hypothetical protein